MKWLHMTFSLDFQAVTKLSGGNIVANVTEHIERLHSVSGQCLIHQHKILFKLYTTLSVMYSMCEK